VRLPVTAPDLRIGLAGLGRMGLPMASRLAAANLLAGVYNRTRASADAFGAATGVRSFATPAELADASSVIVTMVADETASHSLFVGADGFLEGLRPTTVVIEMATVSLEHLRRIAALVGPIGCSLIDAPVSGSVSMARDGSLSILVGGDAEVLERVRPALAVLGSRVFHLGGLGAGSAMKLSVNTVVYALNQGISEGLVLAERAGVQRHVAYEVFANSAIAAPFVHYRREQFEHPGDLEPLMSLHLAAKDLRLILRLAAGVNLELPQAEADLAVLDGAVSAGFAEADVSAVAELLRQSGENEAVT
jgi:3-hydroxyisobutyrate dehydrogenase-like beta-hydroxyacid dehydrogenase